MSAAGGQAAPGSGAIALPSDAEIRKLLAERVDAQGGGFGIVVGVIGPQGRRVVSYGHPSQGDPRPLAGDTGFEIGSVGKVFTALLLADMVGRGEVALADPVAEHLPAGVKVPERNGRAITLADLATHTSGLPFMPDDAFDDSPKATRYTSARLYQFLARYQLPRDVGAEWEYSNVGYWLLGEALASRGGKDYESLLRARILAPLHLQDTAITLSPRQQAKLAPGHDASLRVSPSMASIPAIAIMPAAGGLVSTADDLLAFLAVTMGYERSPLAPAMANLLGTRRPMSRPDFRQALGWVLEGEGDAALIVHDGGTLGYASSVAWDPRQRVGVVVLANQVAGVGDLARHLLRPDVPLAKPAAKHTEITLDSAVLDAYAGRYEAPGEGLFVVAREGDFLTLQLPGSWGLPKMRLHPESRRD
ncbi:MAG TPA: serine hydrolase, partial [Thermoanaerobaculia bacterium]|nr:serine hydrolase [Thermoanaerobaculia bacterium]